MSWWKKIFTVFRPKDDVSFYNQLSLVARAAGSDPDQLIAAATASSEKLNNDAQVEFNESEKDADAAKGEYARELHIIQEKRDTALNKAEEKRKTARTKAGQAADVKEAIKFFQKKG